MTKFQSLLKQLGTALYPSVKAIEVKVYRLKNLDNVCKHGFAKEDEYMCRGCEEDFMECENFFAFHLDFRLLFHPNCDWCERMKQKRTTDKVCHHDEPKSRPCSWCSQEEQVLAALQSNK